MIFLVPVAWALHLTHQNDVIVFVFTFLSVIPLANLLSFATEQLALRVGEAIGGLLNASFGNAVEVCLFLFPFSIDIDAVHAAPDLDPRTRQRRYSPSASKYDWKYPIQHTARPRHVLFRRWSQVPRAAVSGRRVAVADQFVGHQYRRYHPSCR